MSVRRTAAVCIAVVGALAAGARATSIGPQPLTVSAATLTQAGQSVVWHVTLGSRFTAASLKQAHRTLCLMIERVRDGSVSGVLCLGARPGRAAQLVYQRVTRRGLGRGSVVAATIRRSHGATDLTASFLPPAVGSAYTPLRWQVLSTLAGPACTPVPFGCSTVYPARPRLLALHVPQPMGCVASGPAYVTNGQTNRRVVALTFDDGPWSDTPQFLSVLERYHVPATFFQIGRQVATYGPAVDRRMLADGDMIGDHTWNHANVSGDGPLGASELTQTAAAIARLTGFTPCLFRAPYGATSPALIAEARRLGFTTIQWNVDPRDWSRPGVAAIEDNVIANTRPGSIIIQHDGGGDRSQTIAALPHEIQALRAKGYAFETVTDLLGQQVLYR